MADFNFYSQVREFASSFFTKAKKQVSAPPPRSGRSSVPDVGGPTSKILAKLDNLETVNHPFVVEAIPVIRQLVYSNEDLSQALWNIVSLGNTGHKIFFDRKVSPEQVDAMRSHLQNRIADWAPGQAGMDGAINKMFAQLMIGGALANEWVVNMGLNGIETIAFVNPEQIYFVRDAKYKYHPYQKPSLGYWQGKNTKELKKLNPQTFKYFALNGDTDLPYGIPPYLPALKRIDTQQKMLGNIDFIVEQLSLAGFLEVLVTKPDEINGVIDTDPKFQSELDGLLNQAKSNMSNSLRDGMVVGFKGDHEFKFNSFARELANAIEVFKNNEYMLSSAIKQDLTLMGRDGSTSETQITVIFIKMLSELKNIQNIVKKNLEFGYAMELRLAGYQFENLKVQFNRSTIQDDLKYQQAEEIKIRNVMQKMFLGMIDQDTAADELGYDVPAFDEPVVSLDILAGNKSSDPTADESDKNTKNKSAKKQRDTNKPVPKNK